MPPSLGSGSTGALVRLLSDDTFFWALCAYRLIALPVRYYSFGTRRLTDEVFFFIFHFTSFYTFHISFDFFQKSTHMPPKYSFSDIFLTIIDYFKDIFSKISLLLFQTVL